MRAELEALGEVLRVHDSAVADSVDAALLGPAGDLEVFLVSNTLWGGAGSIADQAGMPQSQEAAWSRDVRRRIEAALILLGDAQIAAGVVNPRTQGWVEVFREWQRRGI
ncbi:MAG: hypothetical protein Q8K89_07185 [Actinomycetota bacterium]|nr:hypothetical protein [Actinomycetota bacterium]